MTIQYEWEIGPLNVRLSDEGLSKVVYDVHWRLHGAEDGLVASVYGTVGLPPPIAQNFIPYENLTKQMVTDWVENQLGDDKIVSFKAVILSNIQRQRTPSEVIMEPPWSH